MISRSIGNACITFTILTLSACGDATATDKPAKEPETTLVTRSECLAIKTEEEKIACFKKLSKQNQKRLSILDGKIETLDRMNSEKLKKNEALLKEFEKDVLDED